MQDDTPILVPVEPEVFFEQLRLIIRQELIDILKQTARAKGSLEAPGLVTKPLYSMAELRRLFTGVSRTTIYDWIKSGKLKPRKMKGKGKLYFFWKDIEEALKDLR